MTLMKQKNKVSARGASRKLVKPSRKRLSLASLLTNMLPKMLPVIMLLVVSAGAIAIYQAMQWLQQQPVERVVMTGDFKHLDKTVLTGQIKPLLVDGFLSVDLTAIREQLEKTPWIYQVHIERRWPGTLLIQIIEQKAIARWGDDSFLNHRGQLFTPNQLQNITNLPLLSGPPNSEEQVMQQFGELIDSLSQQGLLLSALHLSERGSWQATLTGEVNLILGSEQIMEKVQRLMLVYQQFLKSDFERVKRIDMRYDNGMAVSWQYEIDKENSQKNVQRGHVG